MLDFRIAKSILSTDPNMAQQFQQLFLSHQDQNAAKSVQPVAQPTSLLPPGFSMGILPNFSVPPPNNGQMFFAPMGVPPPLHGAMSAFSAGAPTSLNNRFSVGFTNSLRN